MQYRVILHIELEVEAKSHIDAKHRLLDRLTEETIASNLVADVIGKEV